MQQNIKEILTTFFDQVETGSHFTSHYPISYSGLRLDVGFGIGKDANIPWIAFLGEQQTVQNGIFPVFYFFKALHKLILAYGVSETIKPKKIGSYLQIQKPLNNISRACTLTHTSITIHMFMKCTAHTKIWILVKSRMIWTD